MKILISQPLSTIVYPHFPKLFFKLTKNALKYKDQSETTLGKLQVYWHSQQRSAAAQTQDVTKFGIKSRKNALFFPIRIGPKTTQIFPLDGRHLETLFQNLAPWSFYVGPPQQHAATVINPNRNSYTRVPKKHLNGFQNTS